jgi:HK97 family phage major capsid protein
MVYFKRMLLPLNLQLFAGEGASGGTGGTKDLDLEKLSKDFNESWKSLKGLLDQQADEMRTHGETTSKTANSIMAVEKKIENFDAELKGITDKFKKWETENGRPNLNGEQRKSFGQQFVESDSYKNIASNNYNASMTLEKSFFPTQSKDLDSSATSFGVGLLPYRIPQTFTPPERPLRMRDLLNAQGTEQNSVSYVVETGFTNNAAVTAEKALKPQSDLTFDLETASVKTIAHWIPASRQIVADANQLRNYVDNRLMYGLAYAEESQFLYGDGTGDNILGIMTNPNIQNAGGMATGDTMIDQIRRAVTRSSLAGYPPTGVVLHPLDYEAIELQKTTYGEYIWVSVTDGGVPRLWRLPVVESNSITQGDFLVGAFGLAGQLWDREQANIRVSEHHSDYFARNMLAILAEERVALTIYRPEAFVRGGFGAQTTTAGATTTPSPLIIS